MKHLFDHPFNRRNTASLKWDKVETLFGSDDVLPLWVADMDFASPPAVIEALLKKTSWGIYGYTIQTDSYFDSIMRWIERRHQWKIKREWICYCPGIVTALSVLVELFTEPGDQVIIQSPVYGPFYGVTTKNNRIVKEVPLILKDGMYHMDFEGLEEAMKSSKLMLLCSPHNPVGRVWTQEELMKVAELSIKNQVLIVSDEIHADIVYKGYRHIPIGSLGDEIAQQSITCFAPSKTFNLAGLKTSSIIIPNEEYRKKFQYRMNALSLEMESYFGLTAVETAYNEGEEWLDELLLYIQENLNYLRSFLQTNMPEIKLIEPQGTYLAWLDFHEWNMSQAELRDFLTQKAKVGLSDGLSYGKQGKGFTRMNMACPRVFLEDGLNRIKNARDEMKV